MSVPIEIKIKIVLLIAKSDSPAVVKRKLQLEFGQKTPGEDCITKTFQRFCETSTVEDRPRSGRPPKLKKRSMRFMMFVQRNRAQVFELLPLGVLSREQPPIEL